MAHNTINMVKRLRILKSLYGSNKEKKIQEKTKYSNVCLYGKHGSYGILAWFNNKLYSIWILSWFINGRI